MNPTPSSSYKSKQGFSRIIKAGLYSLQGFKAAWQHEAAFQQELILALILVPLGLYLGENGLERAVLIAPVLLILVAELLNSAIEAVVDRLGDEYHILSGRAKDLGSAAVFMSLVLLVFIWGLILF